MEFIHWKERRDFGMDHPYANNMSLVGSLQVLIIPLMTTTLRLRYRPYAWPI